MPEHPILPAAPAAPASSGSSAGKAQISAAPIAVFVHVHFTDVWEWMAPWIAGNLRRPFHLVLTTSGDAAGFILPETPFLLSHRVLRTENRGRDVRPFLEALGADLDYAIGLKLHTKRSTHRLDGADWGRMLVEGLLPDPTAVERLLQTMEADPRLALIGPDGMLVSMAPWMQKNAKPMRRISQRLGLAYGEALRRTPVFAAGSMFWFRKSAFAALPGAALDDLFEPERGQVDGTAAHALERLFSLLAEADGGVVTTVRGAAGSAPGMGLAELRASSRRLADQPNDFLVPLGRKIRFLLRVPGLRALYQAMPTWLRRGARTLRRFDRP